ncbi:MAG: hypothetical protein K8H86_01595 [Ignavibacteriaceae bacterium]|nr:hypothetical protein [Ignavibacteriaceae bacterium]
MLFIVNKDIPAAALKKLEKFGETIVFETIGITYPAISNHPDIFFCVVDDKLVYAPNIHEHYIDQIKNGGFDSIAGSSKIGCEYPSTAKYNAAATNNYFIHNKNLTDETITKLCLNKKLLDVKQGYTRCNLLALKNNNFITSDRGIEKKLIDEKLPCLFVQSDDISLPGFKHGFFGGACGVFDDNVFILGNLKNLYDGQNVKYFLEQLEYNIIELNDGNLFDAGSILIINQT